MEHKQYVVDVYGDLKGITPLKIQETIMNRFRNVMVDVKFIKK